MAKVSDMLNKYNGQTLISQWYKECYPTDDWGYDGMNKAITFQDAFECLQVGFDFYTFLGVSDSIVRERVFDALATLMGCSYDHIYYQWLNGSKKPLGGQMITDMQGMRFTNEGEQAKELTEQANEVLANYANFQDYEEEIDEEDQEMLLEHAMNAISDLVHFINH